MRTHAAKPRRLLAALGLGLAALAAGGSPARANDGFFLNYGQSFRGWTMLNHFKDSRNNTVRLHGELERNMNSFETVFGSVGMDFDLSTFQNDWPDVMNLALWGESSGIGVVTQPANPELYTAAVAAGFAKLSFRGTPWENFFLDLGVVAGAGVERRLRAAESVLSGELTPQKNTVLVGGLDVKARKTFFVDQVRFVLSAQTRETAYQDLTGKDRPSIDPDLRSLTHDWQGRMDISHSFWNVHGLIGPNPHPSELLPRTWDRVANTHASRRLGSMSGGGLGLVLRLGDSTRLAALGGFYQSWPGGELRIRWGKANELRFTSYKIANGEGFRTLDKRIYSFHCYFPF